MVEKIRSEGEKKEKYQREGTRGIESRGRREEVKKGEGNKGKTNKMSTGKSGFKQGIRKGILLLHNQETEKGTEYKRPNDEAR